MFFDRNPYIVVKKSTQCGISEWLLVETIMGARDVSVFYTLPTDTLKNRFVQNRFDRSVEFTPYYQALLRREEYHKSSSTSLKHLGRGAIAFSGSNSTAPFTEFPADWFIVDELDECDQDNLIMGEERLSASTRKRQIKVANPTLSGFGIDTEWRESDQKEWYIRCSSCGHEFHPDFFKNVVRQVSDDTFVVIDKNYKGNNDINPICEKCGKPFDRFAPGEWIVQNPAGRKSGYHISKMFSGTVTMRELVDRFNKGLSNDSVLARFYNADLGLAFTAKGARIDTLMLDECVRDYGMPDIMTSGVSVMGVDVGKVMHVRINEITANGSMKAVYIGTVKDEQEVADLYRRYRVRIAVVDAMPEYRMSRRLCSRFKGFFMCYYGGDRVERVDIVKKEVTVPRTPALDAVKEAIITQQVFYPRNAASIPDFYDQMTASTRVYDEDRDRYHWDEGNAADHYFHAECYAILAKRIMVNAVSTSPVEGSKTA